MAEYAAVMTVQSLLSRIRMARGKEGVAAAEDAIVRVVSDLCTELGKPKGFRAHVPYLPLANRCIGPHLLFGRSVCNSGVHLMITAESIHSLLPYVPAGAVFSDDMVYRYRLWRTWDPDLPTVACLLCCNPSTADHEQNDPTIRRCLDFAKQWGYGQLLVGNLFALRATDPQKLRQHPEPTGGP